MMCNCQMKKADTEIEVKVRVMSEHRDEWRVGYYCKPCADLMVENGLGRVMGAGAVQEPTLEANEPYSEPWLREHLQESISGLAREVERFLAVDREDVHAVAGVARWIEFHSRNITAQTAWLARLSSDKYQARAL